MTSLYDWIMLNSQEDDAPTKEKARILMNNPNRTEEQVRKFWEDVERQGGYECLA